MTWAMPPVVVFSFGSGRGAAPPCLDDHEHLAARECLLQELFGLFLDLQGERVARLGEAQDHRHLAGRCGRMFDESARYDILSGFGMDDRREQLFDLFFHNFTVSLTRQR